MLDSPVFLGFCIINAIHTDLQTPCIALNIFVYFFIQYIYSLLCPTNLSLTEININYLVRIVVYSN